MGWVDSARHPASSLHWIRPRPCLGPIIRHCAPPRKGEPVSIAERSETTSEPTEQLTTTQTTRNRRLTRVVVPLLAILGALIILLTAYQFVEAGKIFHGVSLSGVDLSGKNRDGARQQVEAVLAAWEGRELTLQSGNQSWQVKPTAIGLQADASLIADQALKVGREGSIFERMGDQLRGLAGGYKLKPTLMLDQQTYVAAVTPISQEIDRPAKDARLEARPDGSLISTESATGQQLDKSQLASLLVDGAGFDHAASIELPIVEIKPEITADGLENAKAQADKILSSPLKLQFGQQSWVLDQQELAKLIRFEKTSQDGKASLAVTMDQPSLQSLLERIAGQIDVAPANARLEIQGTDVKVVEQVDGQRLDIAKALKAIPSQALSGERTVNFTTEKSTPAIETGDAEAVRDTVVAWLAQPVVLKDRDKQWMLDRENIAGLILFREDSSGDGMKLVAGLADDKLSEWVATAAEEVNQPAKDARFRWKNNTVTVLEESQVGREIDVPSTTAALDQAITSGQSEVEAIARESKPQIVAADKDQIIIRDKLMEASTYYYNSAASRAHNVELAAGRMDGALVPPGGIFSFDKEVGPTTLAAGFQMGYGISTANGKMETVPAEAGGICQVSTTLFHSVFWAGLEIVERYEHAYWISTYGQPPRGMKGLDATVFTPAVDFKFKNNTDNWIAVKASAGGGVLTFSIYGTNPGWEVKVDGPKISNYRPADPTPVNQVDPSRPAGSSMRVEYAQDGFDAVVVRTVLKDGKVLSTDTISSSYQPSRNVFLVGPPAKPEPTPTAEPQPTAAPTEQPQPTATAAPEQTPQPEATPEPSPEPQATQQQ